MTTLPHVAAEPAPFTPEDFAARMRRAADAANEAGLVGLLVTPGPDLLYLSGYAPVAITERITMLVIPVEGDGFHLVEEYRYPIGKRTWNFPQGSLLVEKALRVVLRRSD